MKYKQCRIAMLLVAVVLSGGCGAFVNNKDMHAARDVSMVERSFAVALHFMRAGNESGAREQFERIVDDPPLAGVTDEALFRLAVLNLRDENGRGETRAKELLDRLSTRFPDSSWSRQAAPLMVYIQETASLRVRTRELKNLRNQNLSLSRDNKELRQSIERLKNLDLELEQKIRR